jgi:hypothetical protein
MKPTMLGLLIAAGAFGASTIYLAMQLDEERTRAEEVLAQSRALNARIAELEKARADLEALRVVGPRDATVVGEQVAGEQDRVVQASTTAATSATESGEARLPLAPPERSAALQKMMRTQLRANFKRLHADIGARLGLSQEDANKLIDLLLDQQMAVIDRGRQDRTSNATPEQRAAAYGAQQEKDLADISALIGAGKMDEYKAYQETLPSRQEVDMLSRQLEAGDANLTADQRDRLVTALAEERKRVPVPKLSESTSREEYNREMAAWQDDYNQRAATRASSILNSEQQTTYTEFQQLSKEMRQQMEQRRAAREAGGPPGAQPVPPLR